MLLLIFQTLLSVNNCLRESLYEDLHQQNKQVFRISVSYYFHLCTAYCYNVAYDIIFIFLQDHCSRNILIKC